MFPYLDLAGFEARTVMPLGDVQTLEALRPGFVAQRISVWSSYVNARLRKRYGNSQGAAGNALPLGQTPPALVAVGTNPPAVALVGRPALGSVQMQLKVTAGGVLGVALFEWSQDGGQTFSATTPTAPAVALGTTGVSAVFPTGTYSADNAYAAATPVPETVLGWIVALVTADAYHARGVNPQDPQIEMVIADRDRALGELKEAADSKDGLFDLPASEDLDSAITTGGPLGYSETSPYVWTDYEREAAVAEDAHGIAGGLLR